MSTEFDPYVKIFVAGVERKEILPLLSVVFHGRFERYLLEVEGFSVEVHPNDDHKWKEHRQDDFLFWSFLGEIESEYGVSLDHYVDKVGQTMHNFWRAGLSAVAACTFEHLLPWNGGSQSPGMPPPWVAHAKPLLHSCLMLDERELVGRRVDLFLRSNTPVVDPVCHGSRAACLR